MTKKQHIEKCVDLDLDDLMKQRTDLEPQYSNIKNKRDALNILIKKQMREQEITRHLYGYWACELRSGERKSINRTKLMTAGVDVDVIDECTDVTTFDRLNIMKVG